MKQNYTVNELITKSQLALSNDELIKIAICFYCPILAHNEARNKGYYSENNNEKTLYSNKNGRPGASSVIYLTLLKKFYPKTFWSISRVVKINKKFNNTEE